jgi:TIR domain
VAEIFLSYAHEDLGAALQVYQHLSFYPGARVWFDKESLRAGQTWKLEVEKAIERADYFVLLISRHTLDRGYVQREIRKALEVLDTVPEGEIFFVPVRLEDCEMPAHRTNQLHRVDLFPDFRRGLHNLVASMNLHVRSHKDSEGVIRLTSHIARFESSPTNMYFVTACNLSPGPWEISHVWLETVEEEVFFSNPSRPLPARLESGQSWSTWIPVDNVPAAYRQNAYGLFRVRLSTGEIYASTKEDTVPNRGSVPGGPIREASGP